MSNNKNIDEAAMNQLLGQITAFIDSCNQKSTNNIKEGEAHRVFQMTMQLRQLDMRRDAAKTGDEEAAIKLEMEDVVKDMINHIESVPPGGYLNAGLEPVMFIALEVPIPPGYKSKPKAERVKILKTLLSDDDGDTGGANQDDNGV